MSDDLDRKFEDLRASAGEPPPDLVARSRSQAAQLRAGHRRARWAHVGIAASVVSVLLAASLTPPGRAATGWIARAAGIGEPPTLPQVGSVPGSAVVLASGELPDGVPFEIVAKRFNGESFRQSAADSPEELEELEERGFGDDIGELICFQVDWPASTDEGGGGMCFNRQRINEEKGGSLETSMVYAPPKRFGGTGPANPNSGREGPLVFMGVTTSDEIAEVRVVQSDREGNETELPSQLIHPDAQLETLGADLSPGVFYAILDTEVVNAANAREAQVTAIAYDGAGEELADKDAFPPLDCPVDPSVLVPEQPEIPDAPRPIEPGEAEAMRRAYECGAPPISPSKLVMDQGVLERRSLPPGLIEEASTYGFKLEPATHDQLASVFAEDFEGATAHDVMGKPVYNPPGTADGFSGSFSHVYLAYDLDAERLVYVSWQDVLAVHYDDGTSDRDIDGLPKEFLRIVDTTTGDELLRTELP